MDGSTCDTSAAYTSSVTGRNSLARWHSTDDSDSA
jgi:hypothetical protein